MKGINKKVRPNGYVQDIDRNRCEDCKHTKLVLNHKDNDLYCTKVKPHFKVWRDDVCDEYENYN